MYKRAMRQIGIAAIALSLASCAAGVAQSGPAGGVIRISNFAVNEDAAVKQAEAECAKHDKAVHVRKADMWTDRLYYDCVAR